MAPMTRDVRLAAEQLYPNYGHINYRPNVEISRNSQSHSINLITEDFIAGYMQDGRMSVVRRFFCLFVTFDLFFISLLWLICVMITGEDIYDALTKQVLHYSIYTSLFDIVMAAVCRFTVLILFYALLYINHWIIIALSTSGSCAFLISKVFVYNWTGTPQPVFEVLLVITSFVLAWGEAWFLDCRVIPQEQHAQNYFTTTGPIDERSPLLEPFLRSVPGGTSESYGNFYSPYESVHNSDEEDDKDEEYKQMAVDSVKRAYELLESTEWKIEKVTPIGDTIRSSNRHKLGKIYRLTGEIDCNARVLLENLFYKIEDVPKWNPTLLESRIIHNIDKHTDITYQATTGGGGGIVKCRDFVNLRCWQYLKNGEIIKEPFTTEDVNRSISKLHTTKLKTPPNSITKNSLIDLTDDNNDNVDNKIKKSTSDNIFSNSNTNSVKEELNTNPFMTLSKSLGAKDFRSSSSVDGGAGTSVAASSLASGIINTEYFDNTSTQNSYKEATNDLNKNEVNIEDDYDDEDDEKDEYSDACDSNNNNVYISAAISIDYPGLPPNNKYIRGENVVSCWAMREINNVHDRCIFEWLLCLDLKGNIPRYFLETVYTTLMQEYMTHLRKYCAEMHDNNKSFAE